MLFVGSFTHGLDSKRRLIFPSVWRNQMAPVNQLFAFPHADEKCLYLYSPEEMQRRLEMLRSGTLSQEDVQAVRSLTASSELLSWDVQGRVRVSDGLLAHAEAQDQVVLVGALTRIELWSVEHFDLALPVGSGAAENVFYGGY